MAHHTTRPSSNRGEQCCHKIGEAHPCKCCWPFDSTPFKLPHSSGSNFDSWDEQEASPSTCTGTCWLDRLSSPSRPLEQCSSPGKAYSSRAALPVHHGTVVYLHKLANTTTRLLELNSVVLAMLNKHWPSGRPLRVTKQHTKQHASLLHAGQIQHNNTSNNTSKQGIEYAAM